jgi:hypothetical protein
MITVERCSRTVHSHPRSTCMTGEITSEVSLPVLHFRGLLADFDVDSLGGSLTMTIDINSEIPTAFNLPSQHLKRRCSQKSPTEMQCMCSAGRTGKQTVRWRKR